MDLYSILTAPAETTGYYIAGYAVFFTVLILYLASFIVRSKNLKQEYEILIELEQEN